MTIFGTGGKEFPPKEKKESLMKVGDYITPKGSKKGEVFLVKEIFREENGERKTYTDFPKSDSTGKNSIKGTMLVLESLHTGNLKEALWSSLSSSYRVATEEEVEGIITFTDDKGSHATPPAATTTSISFGSGPRIFTPPADDAGERLPPVGSAPMSASPITPLPVGELPSFLRPRDEEEPAPLDLGVVGQEVPASPETSAKPAPTGVPAKEEQNTLTPEGQEQERVEYIKNRTGRLMIPATGEDSLIGKNPFLVTGASVDGSTVYGMAYSSDGVWKQWNINYKTFKEEFTVSDRAEKQKEEVEKLKGQVYKSTLLAGISTKKEARGVVRIVESPDGEHVLFQVFDEEKKEWGNTNWRASYKMFFKYREPLNMTDDEYQTTGGKKEKKQKDTRTLEERFGLTPEQLAEREALEAAVAAARQEYVAYKHEHTKTSDKLKSFFGFKSLESDDVKNYHDIYQAKLEALRQFDNITLQNNLVGVTEVKDQKAAVESFLKRYSVEEWSRLWMDQEAIKVEKGGKIEKFFEKIATSQVGQWYKNLPLKYKIPLAATVAGGHLAAAALVGGATIPTAIGFLSWKLFTGSIAYHSSKGLAVKGTQFSADYLRTGDIRSILKNIEKDGAIVGGRYADLNQLTAQYSRELDKRLAQKNRQNIMAKSLLALGIFGLPASRFASDMAGIYSPDMPTGAGEGADTVPAGAPTDQYAPSVVGDQQASPIPNSSPEAPSAAPGTPPTEEVLPRPAAPATVEGVGRDSAGHVTERTPAEVERIVSAVRSQPAVVEEADRARGLWGILESRLPENMPEAEKNRLVASMERTIQEKLSTLTDAQIQDQYGFSSRDINLIHKGETLRLDALLSQEEIQNMLDGKTPGAEVLTEGGHDALPPESPTVTPTPAEAALLPDDAAKVALASTVEDAAKAPASAVRGAAVVNTGAREIRFTGGGRVSALPPIDQQQGNYTEAMERNPRPFGDPRPRVFTANYEQESVGGSPLQYSMEQSSRDGLFAEYANESVNIRSLYNQNMMSIGRELFDIDTTEFGPNYQPTQYDITFMNREFGGRPMSGVLNMEDGRYVSEYEDAARYGSYRQPTDLYPRGLQPPDVNARDFENDLIHGYTGRVAAMANRAAELFGNAGRPQLNERLSTYLTRVGTLVTRAKLQDTNFNFDF